MSFLGFANFYCRFIYGYSEITVPLTWLTQKDVPWVFSDNCWKSFKKLKKAFITTLVLTHWIPDTPIMVETDASDYTLAATQMATTTQSHSTPGLSKTPKPITTFTIKNLWPSTMPSNIGVTT